VLMCGWAGIMGRVAGTGSGYECKPKGYYMSLSADGTCYLHVSTQKEKIEIDSLLTTENASNITANQWYTLMLRFSGSTITGFVDKIQILNATDSTIAQGMVGLVSGSRNMKNNIAMFDNLMIKSVNGTPPSPSGFSQKLHPIYKHILK